MAQPRRRPRALCRGRSGTGRWMGTRVARERPGTQARISGVRGRGGRSRGAQVRMRARTKRQHRCCVSHASGRACNPGRGARAARRTHRAVDADGGVHPPHFGGLLQVKVTTLIGWKMNPSDVLQAPCGSARDQRRLTGSRSARLMMLVAAAAAAAARDWLMRRCTRAGRCAVLIGQLSVSSLSSSACLACERDPKKPTPPLPHRRKRYFFVTNTLCHVAIINISFAVLFKYPQEFPTTKFDENDRWKASELILRKKG